MKNVELICDKEIVTKKVFCNVYNKTDEDFNAIIKNNNEKGYFIYEGLEFYIKYNDIGNKKINNTINIKTNKIGRRDRKVKITNAIPIENPSKNHRCYYFEDKRYSSDDIANMVGVTRHCIYRLMDGLKSATLNGVNIKAKIRRNYYIIKDGVKSDYMTIGECSKYSGYKDSAIYSFVKNGHYTSKEGFRFFKGEQA